MDIAKQAVSYYCSVTGKDWGSFFSLLDEAMGANLCDLTGDLWLVRSLVDLLCKNGITINELKSNKDVIKSVFDNDGRRRSGEFFTPIIWAEELHKYMDRYIPNWREECYVWEFSCGTGNLIRTAGIVPGHLFASTLQGSDIEIIRNTKELEGCTSFQLDFLSAVDDGVNNEFFAKLPAGLQDVILGDKPLVILANPPYKSGMAKATEVGRYMGMTKDLAEYNFTDMSKPSYDLFYQCCFQVMNMVARFKLKNTHYCFFGPLTFFTGAGANILLKEFERCFEFRGGMCISAQEFSDTSSSILWGISGSVWESRGCYCEVGEGYHKDILLDKRYILPDGTVGCDGKVLYEPPREKLSSWVVPRDGVDGIGKELKEYPLMSSHLTFKGGDVFGKVAYKRAKMRRDALGTLMVGNTLTRRANQSAVMSMPSTIQYTPIVEENFWRCVASYTFRRIYDASWAVAKKEISAPNTGIEGYDIWLKNAIVLFLFEYKSITSSLRGVTYDDEKGLLEGSKEVVTIRNHLFYLTEAEVRGSCHDEVILRDLEENPPTNKFLLARVEESKAYWSKEIRALYDWCKGYTLETYDRRKEVGYRGSLECWDAGFQQLRKGFEFDELHTEELSRLLGSAREYMRCGLDRFGFVSEIADI